MVEALSAVKKLTLRSFRGALEAVGLKQAVKSSIDGLLRLGVPSVRPRIERVLAHDSGARTQGLMYRSGLLYESTGSTTRSTLRCVDPTDGSVLKLVKIHNDYAEGIAAVENRLFQLSWKSGIARIFRLPDLVQVDQARYEGEGWGLAACRDGFIMSNGSWRLQLLDANFQVRGQLAVGSHGLPLRLINDVEYVDGLIYANVLYSANIWIIAAETGSVVGLVDCSELVEAAAPDDEECVLNGIAYNHDRGTFFLTGKNWNYLFEVKVPSIRT